MSEEVTELKAPTGPELCEVWREDVFDEYEIVDEEYDVSPDDYGHQGSIVFHRIADDTFWIVRYSCQSEYHSFRDDGGKYTDVYQCWPITKTITAYTTKKPK